jgi:9-cis-epoxycarotenoid dioxygenase
MLLLFLLVCIDALSPANPPPRHRQRSFLHKLDRFLTTLQKPEEKMKDYIYLKDNYAPVSQEHINLPVTVIEGELPAHLNGMYCRNGPNPIHFTKLYHWFDGHAMVHNLRFENGRAFYTSQFVKSTRYQIERELDEAFYPTLGEYTGFWGLLKLLFHPKMVQERVEDFGKTSAAPNTSCLMYRNKFYCLNEANVPFECRILPDGRLEPVGYEYFDGALDFPVSAHPRIDHNGDLLFHSYTLDAECLKRDGSIKVGRYSAASNQVESYFGATSEPHVSFAHNLLFTDRYMIIYDCSVHFDAKALFDGGSFFRTNSAYNLRFGIIPKTAVSREDVMWFDTGSPGGIVHPLNSWEEDDGTIVIWTPLCENLVLDFENEEINMFRMVEFRLNPRTGSITREVIDDSVNVEFSVVPVMGRFTRFGYTAIQDPSTPGEGSFSGFCVWDMVERKLHKKLYYDDGEVGGEPTVIQSGDKVYVGVYLQKGEESSFVLYDSETTKLVVRLRMPYRVPYGFHGLWVTGDELRYHFQYHEKDENVINRE